MLSNRPLGNEPWSILESEINVTRSKNDNTRQRWLDKKIVKPTFDFFINLKNYNDQWVEREGQTSLALDIADAIRLNEHIMIEAGVGIGKSFAYLYPGLLLVKELYKPIVLATSSIALSEQLVEDAKVISSLLGINAPIVLGKGMNNYVCQKRIDGLQEEKRSLKKSVKKIFSKREVAVMSLPPSIFVSRCKYLERATMPDSITDFQWNLINVQACDHHKCDYKYECGYVEMRSRIKNFGPARVIVVNQDYLLAHLLKKEQNGEGFINNNKCLIVIDEAHNLEEKARSALTNSWDLNRIFKVLDNLYYPTATLGNSREHLQNLKGAKQAFCEMFNAFSRHLKTEKLNNGKGRDADRVFLPDNLGINGENLLRSLQSLYTAIVTQDNQDRWSEATDELGGLRDFIDALLNRKTRDCQFLFWLCGKGVNMEHSFVSYAPSNIGDRLNKLLFCKDIPIVLTSATLCQPANDISEMYDYIAYSIGFDGETEEPKDSPFNYDENALLFIPNNIAAPNEDHEQYLADVADCIAELSTITQGRTMVLFTAKDDLNAVFQALEAKKMSIPIVRQADGSSQATVIRQFRESKGVALVTGAFWEGINIPGQDLTSLIIAKLPFPVPDPIIEYKISQADNNYLNVVVPEMLLKLRQGSGRLIRSETDKGILTILDSRIGNNGKSYRQKVLSALPIKQLTDSIEDVKKFVTEKIN